MAIFDNAKLSLKDMNPIDCRNAMTTWTTYLESLSSRKSFEEELGTMTYAIVFIGCGGGGLHDWLNVIARKCKDSLRIADSISFTTYLEGGN
jgi:hypothetical protein